MLQSICDYLPVLASMSPITVIGLGIIALATLMYLFTRSPEFLLVIITAVLYAAVPLIHRV